MDKYPKPASKSCTKKILDQMENSIYKIDEKEVTFKLGFFCNIQYKNKNIPVLISNIQILNEIINNSIDISLNRQKRKIKLGETLYYNNKYNIAILEIKEQMINEFHFLELDDNLFQENIEMYYSGESIYIIHYNKKEKDLSVSYGVINNINNYDIIYSANIKPNKEISPIFNLSNNKIFGIHNNNSSYYNKGKHFSYFIKEFINEYHRQIVQHHRSQFQRAGEGDHLEAKESKNEIEILVDVNFHKENEKIYFLDNF